jgi:hypothetical protein
MSSRGNTLFEIGRHRIEKNNVVFEKLQTLVAHHCAPLHRPQHFLCQWKLRFLKNVTDKYSVTKLPSSVGPLLGATRTGILHVKTQFSTTFGKAVTASISTNVVFCIHSPVRIQSQASLAGMWRSKWRCQNFHSRVLRLSPVIIIPSALHTHTNLPSKPYA